MIFQTVAVADNVLPEQLHEKAPQQSEVLIEDRELWEMDLICEDESLRGETEKHFLCEDGSYIAVSYGSPIHYQDDEGNWKEIDNTLRKTEIDGITAYTNKDGIFDVEFSTEGEDLVTIEKDGYTISWDVTAKSDARLIAEKILDNTIPQAFIEEIADSSINKVSSGNLAGLAGAKAAIINPSEINNVISKYNLSDKLFEIKSENAEIKEKNIDNWTKAEKMTSALKASSELSFESAFDDEIDLEYVVTPTAVKENIILNSASEITSYVTTLTAENLTAILKDDNSIELCNPDGETIFTIASPYMFDSENENSFNFEVTLENGLNGEYIITYTPSLEWLSSSDRVYPITVDPTVNISAGSAYDTYVVEDETSQTHNTSPNTYIGRLADGKYVATYLRFSNTAFPALPVGAEIAASRINIFLDPEGSQTPGYPIKAFHCDSQWNETTVLYSTNVSTTLISSSIAMSTNSSGARYYSIGMKDYVVNGYAYYWRTGSLYTDYGVKLTTTQTISGNYDRLVTNNDTVNTAYRPTLWINYTAPVTADIEDGIYYINNFKAKKPLSINYSFSGTSTQAGIYTNNYHACQRWRFVKQSNGYYTIESVNSDDYYLALSSNSTVASDGSYVYARYFEGTLPTNAYWKIFINDGGTYRIANKSHIYRVLECKDGSTANYTPVQTYVYEEPGNDNQKWNLLEEVILNTPRIGQETNMWCWVASSLMSAKTYNSSISKSQSEIVMHINGRLTDSNGNYETADSQQVVETTEWLLNVDDYEIRGILTKDQLMDVIRQGHPVIVGRVNQYSGHMTVVYGFRENSNSVSFFIRDPWPAQSSPWPTNNTGQDIRLTYEEIVNGLSTGVDNYQWVESVLRQ